MKKQFLMTLAAVSMVAGFSMSAQANQAPAAAPVAAPAASAQQDKSATHLSADELAFAAKLSDQNRKVFSSQFNGKQREEAMKSACAASGACASSQKDGKVALSPNDAVQKIMKDGNAVAEKKEVNVQAAPAVKNATPSQVK